jgi:hypothetical protein
MTAAKAAARRIHLGITGPFGTAEPACGEEDVSPGRTTNLVAHVDCKNCKRWLGTLVSAPPRPTP